MAADPTVIDRIADALDIKYRRYFRDGTGGARLTFEERRLLDAVRANPSSGQMLALTPYLRDAGQGTETEENALYNVGVALGVRDREIKSVWDRISNLGSDFVTTKPLGDDYNYPSDVPPVPGEPAAGRLPGGGEAERSPVVDAIIDLMGEEFRKWYGGRESGLSVADRKRAAEALANPSNPDLQALAKFSVYPSNMPNREIAFMQAARDMAGPVRTSVAQEEQQLAGVVETLSETRVAYYDPDLGRAVYLAPREAREQGLSRVVTQEPAAGEPAAPAAAPPSETMVSVYNPQTSTVERMTAQDAIDLGLMTREEVSALYSAGVGVSGVATGMGGVPAGGDGAPSGGLGGVAGGVVPPAEDVMLPEDWEKAAEEQYGAYWAIFKYNPELKQILLDATMNDWSDDKFRAALEQTDWWKTTTQSARQFDMEEATDPATVQTKIDNRAAELQQIARTQGVTLAEQTASQIARDSLRGGWNYQTYSTAVTSEAVKSTAGLSQLRAGKIGQDIREMAASYGISLSDTEINSYVNKFAVGEESNVSFEGKMREYAKVLYPAISNQIDAGSTFTDIVAPYRSKAAAILELEPDQIDFMDSKYLAAVTKTNDKGEQSMMSAREWEQELRTNRQFGYEFTQQAQSSAYSVADEIANLFGRV